MEDSQKVYTDDDLIYAATDHCPCGAGLAYPDGIGPHGSWDCAAILTGRAVPSGQPGSVQHTGRLPFAFWKVKSELQPSADGATTRPSGIPRKVRPAPVRPPDRLPRITAQSVIDDKYLMRVHELAYGAATTGLEINDALLGMAAYIKQHLPLTSTAPQAQES